MLDGRHNTRHSTVQRARAGGLQHGSAREESGVHVMCVGGGIVLAGVPRHCVFDKCVCSCSCHGVLCCAVCCFVCPCREVWRPHAAGGVPGQAVSESERLPAGGCVGDCSHARQARLNGPLQILRGLSSDMHHPHQQQPAACFKHVLLARQVFCF